MSYRRFAIVLATTAGCATAVPGQDGVDGGGMISGDAAPLIDAQPGTDGAVTTPDAPGPCTVVTRNLLANGNFDTAPLGTGWTATPIDPIYPLVTGAGTVIQSAPNRAWLGGIVAASGTVTDVLYQDVAIPASTTALTFTGFQQVRSGELLPLGFDFAFLDLVSTANAPLEAIVALEDGDDGTTWVPISATFPTPYAGQTVRVRMTSSNDRSGATSFYFDTLALNATFCE